MGRFRSGPRVPTPPGVRKTDAMLHFGQRMAGRDQLEADFALVRLEFVRP